MKVGNVELDCRSSLPLAGESPRDSEGERGFVRGRSARASL
ncbi:hypothetical protein WQQ_02150 [Hydrocarboniphaga effusa AP103]|uniref:Uncharacterized protein n=1 Tax=Hydrocarboniphaga effusa AP103 TaxID=1172194 RepID=I8T8L5_9GAMM|nr:hypothetical protein WQQ_00280 [Hydrocarboniphaga effusa AP103]EIT70078.1 hypothetical protein WQQ_02150 [Hydrocarboniphaga effusa AP103]